MPALRRANAARLAPVPEGAGRTSARMPVRHPPPEIARECPAAGCRVKVLPSEATTPAGYCEQHADQFRPYTRRRSGGRPKGSGLGAQGQVRRCLWPGCDVPLKHHNARTCLEHRTAHRNATARARRAEEKAANQERRETYCRNGHPRAEYTVMSGGQRRCLRCAEESKARRRAERARHRTADPVEDVAAVVPAARPDAGGPAMTLRRFIRHAGLFGVDLVLVYETAVEERMPALELGRLALHLRRINPRWRLTPEQRDRLLDRLIAADVPEHSIREMVGVRRGALRRRRSDPERLVPA